MNKQHNYVASDKKAKCTECGKILFNKQSLDRHKVTMHRFCKISKLEFMTKQEKDEYLKIHKTFKICNVPWPSESKLK